MNLIKKIKKAIREDGVANKINTLANILVIVFIFISSIGAIVGSYHAFIDSETKLKFVPSQNALYSKIRGYEIKGQIDIIVSELHNRIGDDCNIAVYVVERVKDNYILEPVELCTIISNIGDENTLRTFNYWKRQPLPKGYINYNRRINESETNTLYLPNITLEKDIYEYKTKEDIDKNGVKSIYGVEVYNGEHDDYYYISVSFKFENAQEKLPLFKYRVNLAAEEINKIIQGL